MCSPGWSGYACEMMTCPSDCSQHGYCNNGTCLCQEGYRGRDCGISTQPQPCQCAILCVRSCLQQCNAVYESRGPAAAHECYTECTGKCVPQCVAGKTPIDVTGTAGLPVESTDVFEGSPQ